MRAVTYHRYGDPSVLTVEDVPEPHAGPGLVEAAALGAAGSYVAYVEAGSALDQIAEAHARSQAGHARGNLVVRL